MANVNETDNNFGFKRLTYENHLEPDFSSTVWVARIPGEEWKQVSQKFWIEQIHDAKLREDVPSEIVKLFEVAKGCLIYGFYFYPLYTLGMEQLLRLIETAVNLRLLSLGQRTDKHGFMKKIDFLIEKEIIGKEYRYKFEALWSMRNTASHPDKQMILPPTTSIGLVYSISEEINALFKSK